MSTELITTRPTTLETLLQINHNQSIVIELGAHREVVQMLTMRKAIALIDRLLLNGAELSAEDKKELEQIRTITETNFQGCTELSYGMTEVQAMVFAADHLQKAPADCACLLHRKLRDKEQALCEEWRKIKEQKNQM